jgi:hypothetical protein
VTGRTWQVAGALAAVRLPAWLAMIAVWVVTWPDGLDPVWATAWSTLAVLIAPLYVSFDTSIYFQLRQLPNQALSHRMSFPAVRA